MPRKPKWTDRDKAALQRLVHRYGAAGVAEKAKAVGRGAGRYPANSGDMIAVWVAAESLMRRDGILADAACRWLSDVFSGQAQKLLGKRNAGYGKRSLMKLYSDAEEYFGQAPGARAHHERKAQAWADANKHRKGVPLLTRMEVHLKVMELRHGKAHADNLRTGLKLFQPSGKK